MPILSPEDTQDLKTRFRKELKQDVAISLFTVRSAGLLVVPGRECPTCPRVLELLQEVVALSPRLSLEQIDFYTDAEVAQRHGIDRVPCISMAVPGRAEPRLRYYGVPAGYEFATLIEDIITISKGVSPLQLPTRKILRKLDRDVHIQVFVTPG